MGSERIESDQLQLGPKHDGEPSRCTEELTQREGQGLAVLEEGLSVLRCEERRAKSLLLYFKARIELVYYLEDQEGSNAFGLCKDYQEGSSALVEFSKEGGGLTHVDITNGS